MHSLRGRFVVGSISIVTLLAIMCLVVAAGVSRVRSGYDQTVRTDASLSTLLVERTKLLDDEETGVRGFLLTRDHIFLQPYIHAQSELPGIRYQTVRLARDEPKVIPLISSMASRAAVWNRWASALLSRSQRSTPPRLDAQMRIGKRLFGSYRVASARSLAYLAGVEKRNLGSDTAFLDRVTLMAVVISALVCLSVLGLGWWIVSSMIDPLARLGKMAERIGAGDFSAGIGSSRDVRELQLLGDGMDHMGRQLQSQRELVATIGSTLQLDRVYGSFASLLNDLVPFDRVSLSMPSDDGMTMVTAFATGNGLEAIPSGTERALDRTVTSLACTTAKPVLRSDLLALEDSELFEDERLIRTGGIRSLAVLPLLSKGQAVGTLNMGSVLVGAYTEANMVPVLTLLPVVAAAVDNARLYRALDKVKQELEVQHRREYEQARHDPLTGLANRLQLDEDLHRLRARVARYGYAYSVAVIDIDYFKQFNDRYGHLAGDAVLKSVSDELTAGVRESDVVYRYGGEEFVIILEGQDAQSASGVGERLRRSIEGLAIVHENRPMPTIITVSTGIAPVLASGPSTVEAILAEADEMLYRAKSAGRNRVEALLA